MNINTLSKITGMMLMLFSITMLPPTLVAIGYHEPLTHVFLISFFSTLTVGAILWLPYRHASTALKTRDGFLVVTCIWLTLSLFSSLPFLLTLTSKYSLTNIIFESVSGLTTTGASVFTHLDKLPRAILYYRQQLHLLGGMGIIVLGIAIMPMLGVGGMQLYTAEMVGPMKGTRLKPRMTQTAKTLWLIYLGLLVLCFSAYWLAGMPLLDAIGESFSTIATGGFTMHDNSFMYYHSPLIDGIAMCFMLASACNFGLHFVCIQQRRISAYWSDIECKQFFKMLFFTACIVCLSLYTLNVYDLSNSFWRGAFTVVSIATTTGFTNSPFAMWPIYLPILIMITGIIGGCGGSTSGGMKVMRCLLAKAQIKRELNRLIHPQAIFPIKLGTNLLPESVTQSIWSFISAFCILLIVFVLILMSDGMSFYSAFGAIIACLANTGASIGQVASGFGQIPTLSKWVCIFAMITGRLEIFTVLVLFSPTYWQK